MVGLVSALWVVYSSMFVGWVGHAVGLYYGYLCLLGVVLFWLVGGCMIYCLRGCCCMIVVCFGCLF